MITQTVRKHLSQVIVYRPMFWFNGDQLYLPWLCIVRNYYRHYGHAHFEFGPNKVGYIIWLNLSEHLTAFISCPVGRQITCEYSVITKEMVGKKSKNKTNIINLNYSLKKKYNSGMCNEFYECIPTLIITDST